MHAFPVTLISLFLGLLTCDLSAMPSPYPLLLLLKRPSRLDSPNPVVPRKWVYLGLVLCSRIATHRLLCTFLYNNLPNRRSNVETHSAASLPLLRDLKSSRLLGSLPVNSLMPA